MPAVAVLYDDDLIDDTEGLSVPDAAERRIYKRANMLLRGRLFCDGKTVECFVLDISLNGVRLQVAEAVAVGTEVMLAFAGTVHFGGEIVWRKGDVVGLRFHRRPEKIAEAFAGVLPQTCLIEGSA